MSIIIGIGEQSECLKHGTLQLIEKYKEGSVDLTDRQWADLLYALCDDILSECLEWTHKTDSFTKLAMEHFSWLAMCGSNAISSEFILRVLDPIEIALTETIGMFVPMRTYNVWQICRIGMHDIAFLPGRDMRIIEWENMIKRGDIKHPKLR